MLFFLHHVFKTWHLLFNIAYHSATSHSPGALQAHISKTCYVRLLKNRMPLKWGNHYFLFLSFEPQLKFLESQFNTLNLHKSFLAIIFSPLSLPLISHHYHLLLLTLHVPFAYIDPSSSHNICRNPNSEENSH